MAAIRTDFRSIRPEQQPVLVGLPVPLCTHIRRFTRLPQCALLALLALLGACTSTTMAVDGLGQFPSPVVDVLPVRLGVYYAPDFSGHKHIESIPNVGDFSIDTGAANKRLFESILPPMFNAVVAVADPSAGGPGVDAVLVPTIDDFQFAVPLQTKTDFSEVWIRYQMDLLDPEGTLIASFPLTAYGKAPSGTLKSQSAALNEAAVLALRDAGAFFAIRFAQTPGVREWLANRAVTPKVPAKVGTPADD